MQQWAEMVNIEPLNLEISLTDYLSQGKKKLLSQCSGLIHKEYNN